MKKWFKDNQAILSLMSVGLIFVTIAFFRIKSPQPIENFYKSQKQSTEYTSNSKTSDFQIPLSAPKPSTENKNTEQSEFEYSLEYIQNTVKAYQKYFQKCYTLALQKEQKTKGATTLKFEITEAGVVSNSQILLNNIQVVGFESCIIEALGRIPFRSHRGGSVQAVLPLNFE